MVDDEHAMAKRGGSRRDDGTPVDRRRNNDDVVKILGSRGSGSDPTAADSHPP